MERTYLNSWQTFMKGTESAADNIHEMLTDPKIRKDAASLLTALRALNACRFQRKALRQRILDKYRNLSNKSCKDVQALVDGVMGLAGCSFKLKDTESVLN